MKLITPPPHGPHKLNHDAPTVVCTNGMTQAAVPFPRPDGKPTRAVFDAAALALAQESIDRICQNGLNNEELASDCTHARELEQLATALDVLGTLEAADAASLDAVSGAFPKLGRFTIQGERGHGGFGIVLKAYDPVLCREVALKLPRPDRLIGGHAPDEFIREAQVAARLDHPGIVRIYEADHLGPIWYIASAYCDGPTLAEFLSGRDAPLPWRDAARLVAEVAEAIHFAHARGVLHLDLKPDNILLVSDDDDRPPRPMVTDFGLAGLRQAAGLGRDGRVGGTPAYMAPEQRAGDVANIAVATDIFSLGVILRELLQDKGASCNDGDDAPARSIPVDLEAIYRKCLREDPVDRYQSARELAEDLQRVLRGECVAARRAGRLERCWKWSRRRPALAALTLLSMVTAVLAFFAVTHYWRRAEQHVLALQAKEQLRAQAAARAEDALLNLAWLAQEDDLLSPGLRTHRQPTFAALRDILREVRTWKTSIGDDATQSAGLAAAAHGLALVGGLDASGVNVEQEFLDGVEAWLAVIDREPQRSQWRRGLAMHLLAYESRLPNRDWRRWLSAESKLDPRVRGAAEEHYARLLIQFGRSLINNRAADSAYGMLSAATELLAPPNAAAPAWRTPALELAALNGLAAAANLQSKSQEAAHARRHADRLLADVPAPPVCPADLARAAAESMQARALLLHRADKPDQAIPQITRAIEYQRRAMASAQHDTPLQMELGLFYRQLANMHLSRNDLPAASDAYRRAISAIDAGLGVAAGHRALLMQRANLQFALSKVLLEIGQSGHAIDTLNAATRDITAAGLCRRDSRPTWLRAVRGYQTLGQLYAGAGQSELSRAAYERSLDLLTEVKPRFGQHPQYVQYSRESIAALANLPHDQ